MGPEVTEHFWVLGVHLPHCPEQEGVLTVGSKHSIYIRRKILVLRSQGCTAIIVSFYCYSFFEHNV